jgi:hypothetical protein
VARRGSGPADSGKGGIEGRFAGGLLESADAAGWAHFAMPAALAAAQPDRRPTNLGMERLAARD